MKTVSIKINNTQYKLEIEAESETVKSKFEEVIKRIAKDAKIKGFRTGCAPLSLVEKYYQKEINSKVLEELIPILLEEAEKQVGLEILETSKIEEVKLQKDYLSFRAYVEVMPKINLKTYKKIKLNPEKIEVSQEEINEAIEKIKKTNHLEYVDTCLAHTLGCKDLEELKIILEKEIFLEKFNLRHEKIRNQIIDYLVKDLDIDLPAYLVNQRKEFLMNETKRQWSLKGFPEEEFLRQQEKISEEMDKIARNQTKVYLVLLEIAKRENIPLNENFQAEVMKFLLREAEW